jgi:hypothetical protein
MANEVINGDLVMVFLSASTGTTTWKSVAHATSHTLSIKMTTRDTANKGSGIYHTRKAKRLDVTGTLEGMYIDNDKYNAEDFALAIVARSPMLMIFGKETVQLNGIPDTTTTGLTHFYSSGQFYLTGVDQTAADQENGTYTVTFEHATGFQINKLITS